MNISKNNILSRIKKNIKSNNTNTEALHKNLKNPKPNLIPKRAILNKDGLLDIFKNNAENVSSTVKVVRDLDEIPEEISKFLTLNNLESKITVLPDKDLDNINWDKAPTLNVEKKFAGKNDETVLTSSFMAIAETGTIVQLSGPQNPITSHFLPDNYIVFLRASRITSAIEGVFSELRKKYNTIPRTLTMISGPSRTGDIALKMEMGAHGPRKVHLLIIDDRNL